MSAGHVLMARALWVVLLAATALCSAADTQALGSTLLCTGCVVGQQPGLAPAL